jgi:drug/metabolite transporter (DMT)-like permease
VRRGPLYGLYGLLVLIWSSTWVGIKLGVEETPPLLGAGARFGAAGVLLLVIALVQRRPLRVDPVLTAVLAVFPFAIAYGLIYWGEQHIPSGLAAVLFGMLPVYVALIAGLTIQAEPLRARVFAGVAIALAGLAVAFNESLALGDDERAGLATAACVLAPLASAVGNVTIKKRGDDQDVLALNGSAMLAAGVLLLLASAVAEAWGDARWSAQAIGAIAYLAVIGSAVPFVVLTLLIRELPVVTISYLPLLLPFGALAAGALVDDERITIGALAGAALVAAGLVVAQGLVRRPQAAAVRH